MKGAGSESISTNFRPTSINLYLLTFILPNRNNASIHNGNYLPDLSDIARLSLHSIIVGGEKIPSNRECVGATDMAISIINAFTRASIVCYLLVLSIVIERHEC